MIPEIEITCREKRYFINSITVEKYKRYYVKEIHVVNGKKMVRTIGDVYLSGESEYVQFEQL